MNKKKTESIRLFSYTSSGTRFLQRLLGAARVSIDTRGPTHAPYEFQQHSLFPLRSEDKPLLIYGDPRYTFISLMSKSAPAITDDGSPDLHASIHSASELPIGNLMAVGQKGLQDVVTRRAKGMSHLRICPSLIAKFERTPFDAGTPTPNFFRLWSQFDGLHVFFRSWLMSQRRPCDIGFLKYESMTSAATIHQLGKFLEWDNTLAEAVHRLIELEWKPRKSNLDHLDNEKQQFLNTHFEDLLEIQDQLPPFYILEKNNG